MSQTASPGIYIVKGKKMQVKSLSSPPERMLTFFRGSIVATKSQMEEEYTGRLWHQD